YLSLISFILFPLISIAECHLLFQSEIQSQVLSEPTSREVAEVLLDSKYHLRIGTESNSEERQKLYLERSKFSAVNIFGKFYESLNYRSKDEFISMLREHHVYLIHGSGDIRKRYSGYLDLPGTEMLNDRPLKWSPSKM